MIDDLLIKPEEISVMSRPCYVDEDKARSYILESELNNVKPAIGDDMYLRLKDGMDPLLLNGGIYTYDGKKYNVAGIKRALAYYVYSRLIESSSLELTRQGVVVRRSEYSDESDRQERIAASRETYAIADRYMEECLAYISRMHGGCRIKDVNNSRVKVRIIGDKNIQQRIGREIRSQQGGGDLSTEEVRELLNDYYTKQEVDDIFAMLDGWKYVGIATMQTEPVAITESSKVYYIAVEVGDYNSFGLKVDVLSLIKSEAGRWVVESLNVPFSVDMSGIYEELSNKADKEDIPRKTSELYNDSAFVNKNEMVEELNMKVNKVPGKQLSTEDFTSELKQRLETIEDGEDNVIESIELNGKLFNVQEKKAILTLDLINYVSYNNDTKTIDFFNNETLLISVDATAFIKDGMVQNVVITEGNLVISFNTDSGVEDIKLPISDIFNASDYYTKDESDNRFVKKSMSTNSSETATTTYMVVKGSTSNGDPMIANFFPIARIPHFTSTPDSSTGKVIVSNGNGRIMKTSLSVGRSLPELIMLDSGQLKKSINSLGSSSTPIYLKDGLFEAATEVATIEHLAGLEAAIMELQEIVFPLEVTLKSSVPATLEFTGTDIPNTLTWSAKRKGEGIYPDLVNIFTKGGGATETQIVGQVEPGTDSGTQTTVINNLGQTYYRVEIEYSNMFKAVAITHTMILPIYYGFAANNAGLEASIANLTKVVASSLGTLNLANPVSGQHLMIAVPQNKHVTRITSNGIDVLFHEVVDKRTINDVDYSYNVVFSDNAVGEGTMANVVVSIS